MQKEKILKLNSITKLIKIHNFSSAENIINNLMQDASGEFKYLLLLRLAKIFYLTKRHQEALKIIENLKNNPETDKQPDQLYLVNGEIYFGMRDYPEALKNFKQAISYRRSAYMLYRVAETYYNMENYKECLPILQELVSISPDDKNNLQLLAMVYKKIRRYKDAEKIYEKILRLDPMNQSAYAALRNLQLRSYGNINNRQSYNR